MLFSRGYWSDSPSISPMTLLATPTYLAHDASPQPEEPATQYMYSEDTSAFHGHTQLDYSSKAKTSADRSRWLSSPGSIRPDKGMSSPQSTPPQLSILKSDIASFSKVISSWSNQEINDPTLYGDINQSLYMTSSQPQQSAPYPDRSAGRSTYLVKAESPASYFGCLDQPPQLTHLNLYDEAYSSQKCGPSHAFDEGEQHETDGSDAFEPLEMSNPSSPDRSSKRSGGLYSGKFADEIDVENEEIPYAQLIYKAMMSVPSRTMILREIYQYFQEKIPRFSKMRNKGWQNSIRHNLSMNGAFRKVERPRGPDGHKQRGYYWVLSSEAEREGVKSTTRFRKTSISSQRKSSDGGNCSPKGKRQPSPRQRKTRSACGARADLTKSSTNQCTSNKSTPESETPAIVPPLCKASNDLNRTDSSSSIDATSELDPYYYGQNFDPTYHPAIYTAIIDIQPALYYPYNYLPEAGLYDESINSAFNEEFALIESSHAHQHLLTDDHITLPQ